MLKIDIEQGITTPVGRAGQPCTSMGSLFFDTYGNLFGYGRPEGENFHNTLYKINTNTGDLTVLATGEPTNNSDGCSCPYTVWLKKDVFPRIAVPCSEVTFTFEIANNSTILLNGVEFFDPLPSQFEVLEMLRNPFGGNVIDTGNPNELLIQNMNIPVGIDSLKIKVRIGEGSSGIYEDQARLNGLPQSLGEFILSDDPTTRILNDGTILQVISLEEAFGIINAEFSPCNDVDCPIDLFEPENVSIIMDCNNPTGNEITVQFATTIRKVGWWGSHIEPGNSVSYDIIENGTHAYNLSNGFYWLYVEDDQGCSEVLPHFNIDLVGQVGTINLYDDTFTSSETEIEFNVLTNDQVSTDVMIEMVDANDPTRIMNLGDGLFRAVIPSSDENIITAKYRVCQSDCVLFCDTASIWIKFESCSNPHNFSLPNVITPFDGNGQNDELVISHLSECQSQDVIVLQTTIVNRWGDVVWNSTQVDEFWDGRNKQGEPLPEGTYYYHIRLDVKKIGIPVIKTGYVTLLR